MKKRADGRYAKTITVGHSPDGRPIRRTIYGQTIKEVEKKYREEVALIERGVVLEPGQITIQQLGEMWLENDKVPNLKPQTIKSIRYALARFFRMYGDLPAQNLTAFHMERFRDEMKAEGRIAAYNVALTYIRSMLNFGIRRNIVIRNITLGMSRLKDPNKTGRRDLTPYEVRAIEAADLELWDRVIIDLLMYTGMREGELVALDVHDIHLAEGYIEVYKTAVAALGTVQTSPKTSAGVRKIPISPKLEDTLQLFLKGKKPFEPLMMVTGYKRMTITTFRQRFKKALGIIFGPDQVPEGLTPHVFRHHFASELYRSGMMADDLKGAQYLLGHSDIKTTMDVYTHFKYEDLDLGRFNSYFGRQKPSRRQKVVNDFLDSPESQ